jgi:hypothetical protein
MKKITNYKHQDEKNHKLQAPNTKQIPITKSQMTNADEKKITNYKHQIPNKFQTTNKKITNAE